MMARPALLHRILGVQSAAEWFGRPVQEVRDRDIFCWLACRNAAFKIVKRAMEHAR